MNTKNVRYLHALKFNHWVSIEWEQAQKGDIVRIYEHYGVLVGVFRVRHLYVDDQGPVLLADKLKG